MGAVNSSVSSVSINHSVVHASGIGVPAYTVNRGTMANDYNFLWLEDSAIVAFDGFRSIPFRSMVKWQRQQTDQHSVRRDPLFADPANGDFRLQASSPAVDMGHPDAIYNDPDGSRNDLGAFSLSYEGEYGWWLNDFPPKIDDPALFRHATWN